MIAQALDIEKLGAYLGSVIPAFGDLRAVEKFVDGQSNPTFRLRSSGGDFVLRRQPHGELLSSAHAVDREFQVLSALASTEVPVPKVHHLCNDDEIIGSMFYIMDFVDGRVYWDPSVPGVPFDERYQIYDQMNKVLADVHRVDPKSVGLQDFGRPGNYYERQFSRWSKQYRATETDEIPEMEYLIEWLEANMVADDGRTSLVHGDYRIDNIMFAHDTRRVVAVMDWELSTLGHPFADLACQCVLWRWKAAPGLQGLGGVDLGSLGIPTEEQYVERYCQRAGLAGVPNWSFYIAFGAFRLAAIAQGVKKRALDGSASSERAMQVGILARPMAVLGMGAIN